MNTPGAKGELQEYYGARAREYDRVYSKPERQDDLRKVEHWLPGVFAGRAILEVACGTGYWTQFLSSAGTRVTALDASSETLEVARSRAPNASVHFVIGDAFRLAERDFANTNVGVEEFLAWARPAIEKEGRPVKVCTVTLAEDPGRVMQWLLENDIGPALLSSHAYRSYAIANQSNDSARTVAAACLSNFPFLRKVG